MTTYPRSLRERVIACYNAGKTSIREVAKRLEVNKDTVHAWIKLYQKTGNVQPKKPGTRKKSQLEEYQEVIKQMVKEHPDYTLAEYCEYCAEKPV